MKSSALEPNPDKPRQHGRHVDGQVAGGAQSLVVGARFGRMPHSSHLNFPTIATLPQKA